MNILSPSILAADCAEDNVQVVFVDSSMPNGARIR